MVELAATAKQMQPVPAVFEMVPRLGTTQQWDMVTDVV